ncbi:MAG: DUF1385 domain-containing protein [Peptostreptococcaceae bacterium]|nr:DUF1385 domain-containing protein [Peptostreptococcaceae bacterium]
MEKKTCPNVGGQALIEGVMMKSENRKSIAIRKRDGSIHLTSEKVDPAKRSGLRKLPLVRGMFVLIDSMTEGVKDMNYAAEFYAEAEEDEKESRFERFMRKLFKDKAQEVLSFFSILMAAAIAIGLFIVLPAYIIKAIKGEPGLFSSFREGLIKMSFFVIYIYLISMIGDIRRVFQYHGAEHKSIFAYERGLDLTVANVRSMPRLHPRCGTNFIFVVMAVSIFLFSFVTFENLWMRSVLKLLFFPLVSGISYELIRLAGKYQNPLTRFLIFPGLMLQKITTREPDDGQIEVAIASLKSALGVDVQGGDGEEPPAAKKEMKAAVSA